MRYLLIILIAYVLGSSSMSFYISKLHGIDMKKKGSKNLGASNTVALIGWKAGIIVCLHDVLKAVLAVMIAKYFFSDLVYAKELAGVFCVLGHIFPFYLKFDGGKGFASYVGMVLALNWRFAIVVIIAILLITLITDYIVLATFTTITVSPIFLAYHQQNYYIGLIVGIASLVILYKHRANIVRLLNGTEMGLRKAHKGEYR